MQPHSARWACRHHMAAMTEAARAFRVLREPLLNEFSPGNEAVHSDHTPPPHPPHPLCLCVNPLSSAKRSPDGILTDFHHFIWPILPEELLLVCFFLTMICGQVIHKPLTTLFVVIIMYLNERFWPTFGFFLCYILNIMDADTDTYLNRATSADQPALMSLFTHAWWNSGCAVNPELAILSFYLRLIMTFTCVLGDSQST